jgi:hypothetical protein
MNISSISSSGVWNAVTRTLTGLGGAGFVQQQQNQSLAAASTIAFQQPAGQILEGTIACTADASGTVVIQLTDGTNTWTAVTIAVGTTGGQAVTYSNSATFWQIHNNSATVAVHWFESAILWVH